jgi:hypothetical protein
MADLIGHKHQDRRLMHDTNIPPRYHGQPPASQDTAPGSIHHAEGRGDGEASTEETANEDDAEDSSTIQDGEQEEDDDDTDVLAPSHGLGKGKGNGKRPAIRVEPVINDANLEVDDETAFHGAGHTAKQHPVNQLLTTNKKRTYSNLSSTSVLFDDSADQEFPRRKIARRLSNGLSKPLLAYKESDHEAHENAVESDDEDYSGVNLIPEDESDVDFLEQQEETFILQEEQQATTLLNEYRDARRLSLESCISDNIFDVTAPLDETFISGLPDFGFAQFFEPDALPASPDLAAKRKYSDSSTKRVRFDDEVQVSDSSSSESSELDSSVFPDLFLEHDQLPPILHHLLEIDNDDDDGDFASPQSDASFWDFGLDEPRITQAGHSDDTDDDSSVGSSGYDCMVTSYNKYIIFTNALCQLTWVTPLTKKILRLMRLHGPLSRTNLSCANRPPHQVHVLLLLGPSSAMQNLLAARYHLLVVCSYMMTAPRPLQSLTGLRRLLHSIVHGLQ